MAVHFYHAPSRPPHRHMVGVFAAGYEVGVAKLQYLEITTEICTSNLYNLYFDFIFRRVRKVAISDY